MHVAGYHRGMQGNFLAVMGQEMSHAPTPKQPICNVFMDLKYIGHILAHPKGGSFLGSTSAPKHKAIFTKHIVEKLNINSSSIIRSIHVLFD